MDNNVSVFWKLFVVLRLEVLRDVDFGLCLFLLIYSFILVVVLVGDIRVNSIVWIVDCLYSVIIKKFNFAY